MAECGASPPRAGGDLLLPFCELFINVASATPQRDLTSSMLHTQRSNCLEPSYTSFRTTCCSGTCLRTQATSQTLLFGPEQSTVDTKSSTTGVFKLNHSTANEKRERLDYSTPDDQVDTQDASCPLNRCASPPAAASSSLSVTRDSRRLH